MFYHFNGMMHITMFVEHMLFSMTEEGSREQRQLPILPQLHLRHGPQSSVHRRQSLDIADVRHVPQQCQH